ncbi:MAG: tetratricopeptide repeat protein, partial [Elusimicrobia bacterium]|nr:tetratricopeptide repeat protein [Elusimicrobiota bacterium]
MRRLFLALALLLPAAAVPARASGAGADPFNFLFLDANARPVALGGAYTALAGDANSLLYNPAGLGRMNAHEATFMHDEHFAGVTQEYAAYASPWGLGAVLDTLHFGDVPRTTYSNPAGSGLGTVGLDDLMLGLGYGRAVADGAYAGAGLKLIRESIAGVDAQAYALDLGAQLDPRPLPGLTLGLALQNLGPSVRFQSASEDLPLNLRMGGAYRFTAFGQGETLALDVTKERSESPLVAFGAETVVAGVLPLRVGFTTRNQAGPGVTAGMGWTHAGFSVDYAFVPYGDLGSAHRVSVTVRWGASRAAERRDRRRERVQRQTLDTPNFHFDAADRARAAGDAEGARRELEAARRRLGPDDRRIVIYYVKSAALEEDARDDASARDLYIQALRAARSLDTDGPAVAGAYIGLAGCLRRAGEPGRAREALQRALEARPTGEQR